MCVSFNFQQAAPSRTQGAGSGARRAGGIHGFFARLPATSTIINIFAVAVKYYEIRILTVSGAFDQLFIISLFLLVLLLQVIV